MLIMLKMIMLIMYTPCASARPTATHWSASRGL